MRCEWARPIGRLNGGDSRMRRVICCAGYLHGGARRGMLRGTLVVVLAVVVVILVALVGMVHVRVLVVAG